MSDTKTHKCRAAGPCWACRHQIKPGETYESMTVWAENGPRRTVRVHPMCKARLDKFKRDDWDLWTYEPSAADLHNWRDFEESCPICHTQADAEWEKTKAEIGWEVAGVKRGGDV